MESENISVNILYSDTLKSIGLSCTLHGSFTYTWFMTSNIAYLENTSSLCYSVFQMLTHFIIQYIYFLITTGLIRRAFKYWEAVKLLVNKSSLKSAFFLKGDILSLATNTVSCFPWSNKLTLFSRQALSNS